MDKEIARLNKEKANVENEIRRAEGMLNNPGYLAKAPAALIESTREKLENAKREAGHRPIQILNANFTIISTIIRKPASPAITVMPPYSPAEALFSRLSRKP